ncbi:MAG: protein kinase, partial [Verrucomicrobiales bacterium]|nr:protein kinase [Verrucomicrobiales bacterium]
MMEASNLCPKCHGELEPHTPKGLCERCLFESLLSPEGAIRSSPSEPSEVLRYFGDYEFLEELGRGGMGVVYKARQLSLGRFVAVKLLAASHLVSKSAFDRFRLEARATAGLRHPNIVPVYEVGEHGGEHFFSMALVEGRSALHERCLGDLRSSARIIRDVARAVHHAHQCGVIHRDIKPANILLDADGRPLLTDFGLAKLVEEGADLTRTRDVLGTPSYMAPELAGGGADHLTTSADVYGLGATLYELITGQPPFIGASSMDVLRQLREKEPVRPQRLKPGIPSDLQTICLKCLQKVPAMRYGSALALADDLDRFLEGRPIAAAPTSTLTRVRKWARRRPVHAALVATATLAVAVITSGTAWFNWQLRQRAEQDRLRLIRMSEMEAARLQEMSDSLSALHPLADAIQLAESKDPAAAERHRYLWMSTITFSPRLAQIWFHDGSVNTSRFDSEGRRVVTASDDGTARIWDMATGSALAPPLIHRGPVLDAGFSPDGRHIVTWSREPEGAGLARGDPKSHSERILCRKLCRKRPFSGEFRQSLR